MEIRTIYELFGCGEKALLGYREGSSMRRDFSTNADEAHNATLRQQIGHLPIELVRLLATLIDVAQDKRVAASTVHEVERNVERVDVAIVRVVNQCQPALSLLHLKTHRYRLQPRHSLSQFLGVSVPDKECHYRADDGVLDRGIVDEGYLVASLTHLYIYR